jgi:hypothetical protein
MLQKRIIAFCTGLLFLLTTQAQVNMQTGSATFSLPVFEWKEQKSRLELAVGLSYSSGSGLRTGEVATNVGQGWNLMAGGVITRMQLGEPDDQVQYGDNSNEHDITKYPDGFIHTSRSPGDGCPMALTRYPIYGGKNEIYRQHNAVAADKQLDYFSFQFNGKAGLFVLDPKNGNACASLGDTKMKITFTEDRSLTSQNIRTTITSFTIQDVDGLIYRFKDHGLSKVLETTFCDRGLVQTQTQPKLQSGGIYHQKGFENSQYIRPWIIGNWYLSEIEDVFNHRKITFNYSDPLLIANPGGSDVSYDSWHNYVIVTHKNSIEKVPVLNSINYPDGHKVTFKYDKDRIDLPGDKALTAVDVTFTYTNKFGQSQTRYLSRHQINTSYFILNRYGTPASAYEKRMARLCLRSVKKLGPDLKDDSPPYIFDYYMGTNSTEDFVPPQFCVSHDIWGYYNGDKTAGYNYENVNPVSDITTLEFNYLRGICYLRNNVTPGTYLNVKSGYAKNGLLKQIIYPTGGTLAYEYEQNTGQLNNGLTNVGGVHVSKTSATDGGYSNNCSNPVTTSYNYVLDGGGSSLWGMEMPDNSGKMTMHFAPEKRNYKWSLKKCGLAGCCYWAFQYPGIMSQTQSISLTGFQKFMVSAEPVLNYLSAAMSVADVVMLACSTGGPPGLIVAVVVDVISAVLDVILSCTSSDTSDGTSISYYSYNMNATSPLPMQFKRVEIVEGAGTNGKTVHEFTSVDDYPYWQPNNPNQTMRQRFASWAYGLPKLTTVLDANNIKVKQTEYVYDYTYAQRMIDPLPAAAPVPAHQIASSLVNCKCMIKKTTSQRYTDWIQPEKYNADYIISSVPDVLGVEFYPMYSGRTELKEKHERVFQKGDDTKYTETRTEYEYYGTSRFDYAVQNYEVFHVRVWESDGYFSDVYYNYSFNYTGGIFDIMTANNFICEPLVINEYRYWGEIAPLGERIVEYAQYPDGDIRPWRKLDLRPPHSYTQYDGLATDYSQFNITNVFNYDASGNLVTVQDEGGRKVANIYDYNDKYVVASVINADAGTDKAAFTSFESNYLGGWELSSAANLDENNAVTGITSLKLAGNACSTHLNIAKPYILSFWANNGNVTVSGGASLVKSAPVINGFTYYEYNTAAGTEMVIVSGNALIDELRVYPKMSRMRTVTYDPLIGKTSECDENNHVTYYEYDDLARLKLIRDENRNIVKKYEYNNVLKQNGCPGIYYNPSIMEYFTKDDCGSGYVGSDVSYTVPAGKYSSTASQEDADAQAEMELMQSGQYTANRDGSCQLIYYNAGRTEYFETQNCDPGYVGGSIPYTVPPRRYSSLVLGEVEQLEAADIAANGQAHANNRVNSVCTPDPDPEYLWDDLSAMDCRVMDNGEQHLFRWARVIDPVYGEYYDWFDSGLGSCDGTLADVVFHFSATDTVQIVLTNQQTGAVYYTYIYPLNGADAEINLPEGTYDIYFNPDDTRYKIGLNSSCWAGDDGFLLLTMPYTLHNVQFLANGEGCNYFLLEHVNP